MISRGQLYDWLLPNLTEGAEDNTLPVYGQVPAWLLAELLVVFTLRDTQAIQYNERLNKDTGDVETVAMLYLQTSFEEKAEVMKKKQKSLDNPPSTSCVASLQKKLEEMLIRDTKQLIHTVGEVVSTARCHYNTVNFLTNIHKRQLIARPLGRAMGCLLWRQHLIYILPKFL